MKTTPMKTWKATGFGRVVLLMALTTALATHAICAASPVPFKGNAEGAIVSASPDPAGVLIRVLAEGDATHLGHFTREEVLILNPSTGTITGTIVYTAANGDQLSGGVLGQFTSATTVVGSYTFTGGTGRFENATGEADFLLSTADGVTFTVEFDGSLSSVGGNKK